MCLRMILVLIYVSSAYSFQLIGDFAPLSVGNWWQYNCHENEIDEGTNIDEYYSCTISVDRVDVFTDSTVYYLKSLRTKFGNTYDTLIKTGNSIISKSLPSAHPPVFYNSYVSDSLLFITDPYDTDTLKLQSDTYHPGSFVLKYFQKPSINETFSQNVGCTYHHFYLKRMRGGHYENEQYLVSCCINGVVHDFSDNTKYSFNKSKVNFSKANRMRKTIDLKTGSIYLKANNLNTKQILKYDLKGNLRRISIF